MTVGVEDDAGLSGRFEIFSRPKDSQSEDDWEKIVDEKNLIPDEGLNKYRDLILGDHVDVPDKFALGIGTTSEASGDTSLENEQYREDFGSKTENGTGVARWEGSLESIEPSNQPFDFSEIAVIFEDGSLGSRITFPAETKDSTQEWRIRYTLTLTNA